MDPLSAVSHLSNGEPQTPATSVTDTVLFRSMMVGAVRVGCMERGGQV